MYYLSDYELEPENDNHIYNKFPNFSFTWDLKIINNKLFVGGAHGLAQIIDTEAKIFKTTLKNNYDYFLSIGYSHKMPNKIFGGSVRGLVSFDIDWSTGSKYVKSSKCMY